MLTGSTNESHKDDRAKSAFAALVRFLLGRPLANREYRERKIGAFEGVPAMGLDGLGSSAYGPEAALTVLSAAGAAGLAYLGPIMLVILVLLAILFTSYWQTIEAYPTNGGAYTVAKENLGTNASLLAAAALMLDYVLNVAVGISAGVGALVSAIPTLQPYILHLCLGILVLLAVINLRGTLDAGRLFALPTYLFVASFVAILGLGIYQVIASGGHPHPVVPPQPPPNASELIGIWLVLRAFASGCTAMTGVEAVSNGVSAFREPPVKYAHRTLVVIVVTLGFLLGGIAYVANAYGIMAMDQTQPGYQSVLSQLVGAVIGRGPVYYVAIGSVLCVLCLSANTSFVDFPRLCRLVAQDGFLPRPFAMVGRRLVFSVGVIYLAVTAGTLLIVFGGITDRLIPLFAIGAFLTFTMSQAGMVVHWARVLRQRARRINRTRVYLHLAINATGAVTTAVALAVIILAKFVEGGWITILVIPCAIGLLKCIRSYYDEVAGQLRDPGPLELSERRPPVMVVATREWNRLTDEAVGFALEASPDVIAVHLSALEGPDVQEQERRLRAQWTDDVERPALAAGFRKAPRLVFLNAPFRRIETPLLKLIQKLKQEHPERTVAVLTPEVVTRHWWEYPLHTHRARRLRSAVLRYGGSRVVVIALPWHMAEPRIEEAMLQEEITEPLRVRASEPVGS